MVFFKVITDSFSMLWSIFKYVFYLLLPIIISFFFWFCNYYFVKGMKFQKGEHKKIKKRSFIKRLLIDFPKRFWLDSFARKPDEFRPYGVHVFCGEQGAGKTVALTQFLLNYQKEYPLLKVKTNYGYKYEDGEITHWKDLIHSNNGIYGEIDVLDEIQNWFNSMQSKDFPPEMMTEITQQRKQRKIIVGTAQVFSRIAKPIREQIQFIYKPITVFGCLTIVRKYKPKLSSSDGNMDGLKLRGCYFFVHSAELRDSFDTYKKIEKMSLEGFKPESEQYHNCDYDNLVITSEAVEAVQK